VQILGTPLLMVLGHEACGAVEAAIKSFANQSTLPGHLPSLVAALTPAVKAARAEAGNAFENTIRKNVILKVERLNAATPIISKFVSDRKVRVVTTWIAARSRPFLRRREKRSKFDQAIQRRLPCEAAYLDLDQIGIRTHC
jgi:carbonic anhydrase